MRKKYSSFYHITKMKSLLMIFIIYASVFAVFSSNAFGYADITYEVEMVVFCDPNACFFGEGNTEFDYSRNSPINL